MDTNINKIRLFVHVHIYYHEQTDYIIKKLKNITGCIFDLYVTYSKNNEATKEKFLKFKNDTHFVEVSNRGFDIWPFICVLRQVNLDDYDYILKLHTKNIKRKKGAHWRNTLFDPLVASKDAFKNCLNVFENNKDIGLIGSKKCLSNMFLKCPENMALYDEVCSRLNIKNTRIEFIAGTVFIVRAHLMKFFQTADIKESDFEPVIKNEGGGTIAHVMERLFASVVIISGYKVYGIEETIEPFSFIWLKNILRKVFLIENRQNNKIIYIFGIPFKISRYAYDIVGNSNQILILDENDNAKKLRKRKIKGLEINIKGDGNLIRIAPGAKFKNSSIEISSDQNEIIINSPRYTIENMHIMMSEGSNKSLHILKGAKIKNLNLEMNKQNCILITKENELIDSKEIFYNQLPNSL